MRAASAPGQYREPILHELFHSQNGQHERWKRPASCVFSPMYTPRLTALSTPVDEAGDQSKPPANTLVFWSKRVRSRGFERAL